MSRVLDLLKGKVKLEIKGIIPEEAANICARNDISFSEFEKISDNECGILTDYSGMKKLKRELPAECKVQISYHGGLKMLRFVKIRYVFALALLLFGVMLFAVNGRIWRIEVSGCETVPESRVIAVLNELGLGIGVKRSGIDSYEIRNSALLKLNNLIWLSVNVRGSCAEVTVRERDAAPEIQDISIPCDLVASKPALITEIRALNGTQLVSRGDTVDKGEILVSAEMLSKLEKSRQVSAAGQVWGRTWYELEALAPLEYVEKSYTGDESSRKMLILANVGRKLYIKSGNPYAFCDKISSVEQIGIAGLVSLPIRICNEQFAEYIPSTQTEPKSVAEERLKAALEERLKSEIGSGGSIKAVDFLSVEENGVLKVTLYAECLEQIAEVKPKAETDSEG